MPVHVEEMTSEVAVAAGDLPLSEAQIDRLVAIVLKKLDQKRKDAERIREATRMRTRVSPDFQVE
jgi:hypothetical protein